MAETPRQGTSVCKFLYDDDCTSIFQIPSRLVKSYGDVLPPTANLRIDQSGKSWRVSIEKFRDHYFFTDGWKEFAEEVDMKTREYLLFNSGGSSEFHVSPDEINGCKEFDCGEGEDSIDERQEAAGTGKRWGFTKKLKKTNAYRLRIPKQFARGTMIATNKKIKLKDAKGRKWPICVTDRNCGQFSLSAGWHNFLVGNKVVVGSRMSFEFISNNVIEARVVKMGKDKNELFDSVKIKAGRFEVVASHETSGCEREVTNSNLNVYCESKDRGEILLQDGERRKGPVPVTENGEASGAEKSWKFTKVLEKHSAYRLIIPTKFAMYTGIATHRNIKLKDAEGKEWPVRVTDKNCGQFSFGAGWKDFLAGNNVVVGSTISFKFILSSKNVIEARVEELGTNEKELFKFVKRRKGKFEFLASHKRPNVTCESKIFGVGSRLSFSKELKKHYAYTLDIPKDFATRTGIAKKMKIKLLDSKGRKWPVHMHERNDQFRFSTGWYDFLKGNSVVVGSTISFMLRSANTLETQIVKEGTDKQALFKFLRRKGGMLKFGESNDTNDHASGSEDSDNAIDPDEVPEQSLLNVKIENEVLVLAGGGDSEAQCIQTGLA